MTPTKLLCMLLFTALMCHNICNSRTRISPKPGPSAIFTVITLQSLKTENLSFIRKTQEKLKKAFTLKKHQLNLLQTSEPCVALPLIGADLILRRPMQNLTGHLVGDYRTQGQNMKQKNTMGIRETGHGHQTAGSMPACFHFLTSISCLSKR